MKKITTNIEKRAKIIFSIILISLVPSVAVANQTCLVEPVDTEVDEVMLDSVLKSSGNTIVSLLSEIIAVGNFVDLIAGLIDNGTLDVGELEGVEYKGTLVAASFADVMLKKMVNGSQGISIDEVKTIISNIARLHAECIGFIKADMKHIGYNKYVDNPNIFSLKNSAKHYITFYFISEIVNSMDLEEMKAFVENVKKGDTAAVLSSVSNSMRLFASTGFDAVGEFINEALPAQGIESAMTKIKEQLGNNIGAFSSLRAFGDMGYVSRFLGGVGFKAAVIPEIKYQLGLGDSDAPENFVDRNMNSQAAVNLGVNLLIKALMQHGFKAGMSNSPKVFSARNKILDLMWGIGMLIGEIKLGSIIYSNLPDMKDPVNRFGHYVSNTFSDYMGAIQGRISKEAGESL